MSATIETLRTWSPKAFPGISQGFAGLVKLQFGPFVLDRDTRQLLKRGRPIPLSPKAFELLITLAANRPNVLSKQTLQEQIWPDVFVEKANISNLIAEVRHALGDTARAPKFIRTSHGFGYAFSAPAEPVEISTERPAAASCWLEWNGKRFQLSYGENVVGRDLDAEIQLDATTVSRRHARLVVSAEGVRLEDFGSKNGTFRRSQRIRVPVGLADGDTVGFGSLVLTFRSSSPLASTETVVETES